MTFSAGLYAYMTTSTADRSDAATWGSRQPPPHVQACERRTACTFSSDVRTDVYKRFLELRTATFPAIPEALCGTPTVHVARKTLTMGAS